MVAEISVKPGEVKVVVGVLLMTKPSTRCLTIDVALRLARRVLTGSSSLPTLFKLSLSQSRQDRNRARAVLHPYNVTLRSQGRLWRENWAVQEKTSQDKVSGFGGRGGGAEELVNYVCIRKSQRVRFGVKTGTATDRAQGCNAIRQQEGDNKQRGTKATLGRALQRQPTQT